MKKDLFCEFYTGGGGKTKRFYASIFAGLGFSLFILFAFAGCKGANLIPADGPQSGIISILPQGGEYHEALTITITCEEQTDGIYYTTDGSYPTIESNIYSGPISVSENMTIVAAAIAEGKTLGMATEIYNIAPALAQVVLNRGADAKKNVYVSVEGDIFRVMTQDALSKSADNFSIDESPSGLPDEIENAQAYSLTGTELVLEGDWGDGSVTIFGRLRSNKEKTELNTNYKGERLKLRFKNLTMNGTDRAGDGGNWTNTHSREGSEISYNPITLTHGAEVTLILEGDSKLTLPVKEVGSRGVIVLNYSNLDITSYGGGSLDIKGWRCGIYLPWRYFTIEKDEKYLAGYPLQIWYSTGRSELSIGGNAKLNIESSWAGIGTSHTGDICGYITIKENAKVYSYAGQEDVGIGGGYLGGYIDRSSENATKITIQDNAYVEASGGIGIGAGWQTLFGSGGTQKLDVLIKNNAVVKAESTGDGAAIGSGPFIPRRDTGAKTSGAENIITIQDNARVSALSSNLLGKGAAIGGGWNTGAGTVKILDNAQVKAETANSAAYGIGPGMEANDGGTFVLESPNVQANIYINN